MKTASLRNLFVKNAVANVLGGAGSALFNILLPALVVRYLGKLEFSVWTLALQILLYLQIFGFGLQTAMTKFIAHANENGDLEDQKKTLKAGLVLVMSFVLCAVFFVALLVIFYPMLFDNIPAELINNFRICIGLLGLSAAFQLLALVPNGMFVGLHRNIIPVGSVLLVRMFSLLTLWVVLQQGGGLMALSVALACCGALVVPLSYLFAWRWADKLLSRLKAVDWTRFRQLFNYCASLAVWNIAMIFVNGVDMIVVGHFDFSKVAAYSLAVTAITVLVGVLQAILNPLVAIGSASYASAEKVRNLPKILFLSSFGCALFLICFIVFFYFFGEKLLGFWVNPTYISDVYSFLNVLLIAHAVRNLMMPFSVLLIAIAEHKKAFIPAVMEGAFNLGFSLFFASTMGAMGVAYATLVGALAGVFFSFILVVNKTKVLTISRNYFFTRILMMPLFSLIVLFFLLHRIDYGNW